MTSGEKIKHLIRSKNMTDEKIMRETGISHSTLEEWKNDSAIPDIAQIILLSQLFNVTTDYLLKDDITRVSTADEPVDFYDRVKWRLVNMPLAFIMAVLLWNIFVFAFTVAFSGRGNTLIYKFRNYGSLRESAAYIIIYLCFVAVVFLIKKHLAKAKGRLTLAEKAGILCAGTADENMKILLENITAGNTTAEEVIKISDYFGVTTDFLLREEVTGKYNPYPDGVAVVWAVAATGCTLSAIFSASAFSKALATLAFYQGEFFTSQRQYPQLIAAVYDIYLPAGVMFMAAALVTGFLAGYIKKKASR